MNLLIVAATPFEIQPLLDYLDADFEKESDFHFKKNELSVRVLITGVGMVYTAFSLGHLLSIHQFDLAINAGIAGAFNRSLSIGDVVQVTSEQFGDLGVEEKDGSFIDAFQLGLIDSNQPPFTEGKISNVLASAFDFLPKCKGLTINKVHGQDSSIKSIQNKYPLDVETMEGAAFFLSCKLSGVSFIQVRSISNFVEPRNRENWNLPLSIQNLNNVLIEITQALEINLNE